MVDSISDVVILNTDAPDYIDVDQLDSAAAIYYCNALALMKLR